MGLLIKCPRCNYIAKLNKTHSEYSSCYTLILSCGSCDVSIQKEFKKKTKLNDTIHKITQEFI